MKHALLALLAVWFWVTPSGTYSYTDDPKNIPARYKEQAVELQLQPLKDYEKYTHADNRRPRRHYED